MFRLTGPSAFIGMRDRALLRGVIAQPAQVVGVTRTTSECGETGMSNLTVQSGARFSHCMIDGCSRSINSRGMCSAHYRKISLYSITIDQMVSLEAGEYQCEICGSVATDVDHCHSSGATRGFLCNPCNRALAAVRDNASVLRSAAAYLDQFTEARLS